MALWASVDLITDNTHASALQAKYDDAKPLFERALDIQENALGPNHPEVAATLNNLAGLLEDQVIHLKGFVQRLESNVCTPLSWL